MAQGHPYFGVARKSRFRGVSWAKWTAKWQAHIKTGSRQRHIGLFHSEEEAARAYDREWLAAGKDPYQSNFPVTTTVEERD